MIVVLCPTRGRPLRAAETLQSFRETARMLDTRIVFIVDRDDPTLDAYVDLGKDWTRRFGVDADTPYIVTLDPAESGNLVRATNAKVDRFWDRCDILGHVGDDHLFRTVGWDSAVSIALDAEPGVAYGDDLFMGEEVPTAAFLSSFIVKALGWLALPTCNHLYIDNAWKTIGERLGSLHYLPDVVIEHMHPLAGKADWDAMYDHGNGPNVEHDRLAFERWAAGPAEEDIARVRAVL